jgi:hypothetical protein
MRTYLALNTSEPRKTCTCPGRYAIYTCSIIYTWITLAFISSPLSKQHVCARVVGSDSGEYVRVEQHVYPVVSVCWHYNNVPLSDQLFHSS